MIVRLGPQNPVACSDACVKFQGLNQDSLSQVMTGMID